MAEDILGYSSHDWRKHTDSAVVVDDTVEHKGLKVNNAEARSRHATKKSSGNRSGFGQPARV